MVAHGDDLTSSPVAMISAFKRRELCEGEDPGVDNDGLAALAMLNGYGEEKGENQGKHGVSLREELWDRSMRRVVKVVVFSGERARTSPG